MEEQSDDLESEDQDIEETEKTELNKEEQTEDLESEDQETEITEQANDENKECLQVCLETRNLNSPQHRCHTCAKPVSTICHCNIQDLNSSNEQHRVHRFACKASEFTCNKCGKIAKSEKALRCHKEAIHPACPCSEDFCNAKFNNMGAFEIHKKIQKLVQRPIRTKKRR